MTTVRAGETIARLVISRLKFFRRIRIKVINRPSLKEFGFAQNKYSGKISRSFCSMDTAREWKACRNETLYIFKS